MVHFLTSSQDRHQPTNDLTAPGSRCEGREVNSDWHRLVGKGLSDLLAGLPFLVVQEMDLSARRSQLDFALIRIVQGAPPSDLAPRHWRWPDLPDGLTDLSEHNLITYRSPGSSAKLATLWELVGYMVDYLKLEHKGDWDPLRAPVAKQSPEPDDDDPGSVGDETARQSRELFLDNQLTEERVRLLCVSKFKAGTRAHQDYHPLRGRPVGREFGLL